VIPCTMPTHVPGYLCVWRVSSREKRRRPPFREACETVVINAHGGLSVSEQPLNIDAILVVTNPSHRKSRNAVSFSGDRNRQRAACGLEFLTPAPAFLGCRFRPADWPPRPPSFPELVFPEVLCGNALCDTHAQRCSFLRILNLLLHLCPEIERIGNFVEGFRRAAGAVGDDHLP